jgi:hypothetical protein
LNGLKIRLAFTLGLLASLLSALAYAQSYKPFPGEEIDHRTRSMQERVDAVYASGDYERALLIYEKELAPIGDKYAQYMVGYMHLNALGVNQDKETALAWYRLAAERGDQLLVQTRDELAVQLAPAEIEASNTVFVELWQLMSDRVLLMELIRRDLQILKAQTGSRIPGATVTRPTVIYRPRGGSVGPNFYRDVSTRLDARLKYLDARVEISDDIIAVELEQLQSEQSAAKEELAAIRNR